VPSLTAEQVVEILRLAPHPEGGFYRETHRDGAQVQTADGRSRDAGTAIYYLLGEGQFSSWHRIQSDEIWHWYAGGPLALHLLDRDGPRVFTLGAALHRGERPQAVVPAGVIQAARPIDGWCLVGCTVAPGFDFREFELLDRQALVDAFPDQLPLIEAFIRAG